MAKAPHAVVTGGGRGIGAATARKFKDAGYRVTLMARTRSEIEGLADEMGAYAVRVDVGDPASVEAAFMAAGPVDVLVNNAGLVRSSKVVKTDVRVWEEHLKVNLTGAFLCALKVLPGMISRGRGCIINVACVSGLKGYPYLAAYCASKHGLIGFTRALASEVGEKGVRVNAICPGYTDTPMLQASMAHIVERSGLDEEQTQAWFTSRNQQDRLLDPQEVADAILFMAGDGAKAMNGQIVTLDGGELVS